MKDKVITLENGLKFLVLTSLEYKNETYLYLSSLDDELHLLFAKLNDEYIELIDDGEILSNLFDEIGKQIKDNA